MDKEFFFHPTMEKNWWFIGKIKQKNGDLFIILKN